jgi:Cd2+/Zn2+-exporting ATPase
MLHKSRFDIQLILPELPDQHDVFADRLNELVVGNEGIDKAYVRDGEFCIHFDPNLISFDKVRSLVAKADAKLASLYGHKLLKSAPIYARYARTIHGRLAAIMGDVNVGVTVDGIIRIEYDKRIADERAVILAISSLGITVEHLPAKPVRSAKKKERKYSETLEREEHGHGGILGADMDR